MKRFFKIGNKEFFANTGDNTIECHIDGVLVSKYECLDGVILAYDPSKIAINRYFRATDQSRLWPILGKCNVTERAIRKIRKLFSELQGYEYYLAVHKEIGRIINDERNW